MRRAAERDGISREWIEAVRRSPVHQLISTYRVALPLHPEFRTMPMVWYIPPLSLVVEAVAESGFDGEDAGNLFGAIDSLRIPVRYLAELFTAGAVEPVRESLNRLAAMRSHMADINLGRTVGEDAAAAVGMTANELERMFHLLAIAKYEDRYVIPTAAVAEAHQLEESALQSGCSLDYDGGPGMSAEGPFGAGSGRRSLPLVTVESFHAMRKQQTADTVEDPNR